MIAGGGGSSSAGGDVASLDPQTLSKIARNKWNEQDYRGAIRAFQAVLANCDTPEEWEKFGWDAWDYIGRSYGVQQRFYESFLAFDQIELAWKKNKVNEKLNELTNETGYSRAAALDALFRQSKDPADRAAAKQALDDFTNDHPTSPRNQDSAGRVAAEKLREAEALRSDPEAYRNALREAMKAYEALDPKLKTAELNQAYIAQIHQKIGDAEPVDVPSLQKAAQLADAWLAQKRPDATDSTVRRSREQGRRIAMLVALSSRASRCASLAKSPDDAARAAAANDLIAALDKYGPEFKDVAANGQQQLDTWRAEGLIGAGKVDEADQLVGKLLQENPTGRINPYLAGIIAAALEHRSLEQTAKGDEIGARSLMLRSARRSEWVLDNLKMKDGTPAPRNPDVVRAVAIRYSKGGEFQKAEALLLEAQKAYDDLAAATQNAEDKEKNLRKSRTCRIELIGLLVRQGKYDAAIPQLEKELAKDPKARDSFLRDVQKTDNYNDAAYRDMIAKTDANQVLLDQLSAAYMKAASKERCYAAVNLTYILTLTMPKDDRHNEAWIDYVLRRGEAYLMLAQYTRQAEHYRAALATVRSGIVIPGLVDQYEATLPGSKKRGEKIMGDAEDGLRKLGTK
jgi:tetratricopeptide (TPR) repeat protein